MARSRPVHASPRAEGRQTTRFRSKRAPFPDGIGHDRWSLSIGRHREDARSSTVKTLTPDEAALRRETREEDVPLPIPIGAAAPILHGKPLGKIVTADGREQPFYQEIPGFVYKPILGLEHCFRHSSPALDSPPHDSKPLVDPDSTQPQAANGRRPENRAASCEDAALANEAIEVTAPKLPVQGKGKRNRSNVAKDSIRREADLVDPADTGSGSDSDQGKKPATIKLRPSRSFYIGDFEEVKKFLLWQFRELTLKTRYGGYHKKLATDMPPEFTPPWWPSGVQVNEPSHLSRDNVLTLAVDFLLLHRDIDQDKRSKPWVAILKQKAEATLELVGPDSFSSSKNPIYEQEMRERATKHILPSIFGVAQSYEDHVIGNNLFEELKPTDWPKGMQHTWQPMPKPLRTSIHAKKNASAVKIKPEVDASGNDTEVDNSVTRAFLSRKRVKMENEVKIEYRDSTPTRAPLETPNASPPASPTIPAIPKPRQARPLAITPFDDPTQYLDFGIEMDCDVEYSDHTPYDNPSLLHSMYPTSQPVQHASSRPGFGDQSFLPQDIVTSVTQSFVTPSTPDFMDPFQTFPTSFTLHPFQHRLRDSGLSNDLSFEHAFQLTPDSSTDNESFHQMLFDINHSDQTLHAQGTSHFGCT